MAIKAWMGLVWVLGCSSTDTDSAKRGAAEGDAGSGGQGGERGGPASGGGAGAGGAGPLGSGGCNVGGSAYIFCEALVSGLPGVGLSIPVGTTASALEPFWAEICRNDVCAVVESTRLGSEGVVVPLEGQREDVLTVGLQTSDGEVRLSASWGWSDTETGLVSGDVYFLRVVDGQGRGLGSERKVATYEDRLAHDPAHGTCDGPLRHCLVTTLEDAGSVDAGPFPFPDGGLVRDGGASTDAGAAPDAASAD